jgi:hypothetical protein
VNQLSQWARQNRAAMEHARQRFDAANERTARPQP